MARINIPNILPEDYQLILLVAAMVYNGNKSAACRDLLGYALRHHPKAKKVRASYFERQAAEMPQNLGGDGR